MSLSLVSSSESPAGVLLEVWRRVRGTATEALDRGVALALGRGVGASAFFLFIATGVQAVCPDMPPALRLLGADFVLLAPGDGLRALATDRALPRARASPGDFATTFCLRRGAADQTVPLEAAERGVLLGHRAFAGRGEGTFRRRGAADQTVPPEAVPQLRTLSAPAPRTRRAKRTKRCSPTSSPQRLEGNSTMALSPRRVVQHLVSRITLGSQRLTTLWIVSLG